MVGLDLVEEAAVVDGIVVGDNFVGAVAAELAGFGQVGIQWALMDAEAF